MIPGFAVPAVAVGGRGLLLPGAQGLDQVRVERAKLTDEGGPNVFRMWGRDDQQGAMVGGYLTEDSPATPLNRQTAR